MMEHRWAQEAVGMGILVSSLLVVGAGIIGLVFVFLNGVLSIFFDISYFFSPETSIRIFLYFIVATLIVVLWDKLYEWSPRFQRAADRFSEVANRIPRRKHVAFGTLLVLLGVQAFIGITHPLFTVFVVVVCAVYLIPE